MTIMNNRYLPALLLVFLFAAGCGQKGPLYLAGNPSEIKTDVPSQEQAQSEEDDDDEDDEEESQNE